MSIVKCVSCGTVAAVYYHVMNKENYKCDSCIKKKGQFTINGTGIKNDVNMEKSD